jgi:hypothetical protein
VAWREIQTKVEVSSPVDCATEGLWCVFGGSLRGAARWLNNCVLSVPERGPVARLFASTAWRRWAPMGACAGGCLLAAVYQPADDGVGICPSRTLFGFWCPGCGMTRAVFALGRAEWSAAWRYHPVVFVLAAQFVLLGVLRAIDKPEALGGWFTSRRAALLIGTNAALLIGVWVYRRAAGQIPL